MSAENLKKFYQFIEQHSEIRSQVGNISDRASFVKNMVRLGAENGFAFTANELESALGRLDSSLPESVLSDEQLEAVAGGAKRVGASRTAETECQSESKWLDPFCT